MGFDPSGKFLLTVSHSGRGVFEVGSWARVARDSTVLYPSGGVVEGIGPIGGIHLSVQERDDRVEEIHMRSPDGRFQLLGESDGITISRVGI